MAEERLGERCEYAYPWRTLRNTGITFGGGSDFPIELHDPLTGIDAFCRRLPFGSETPWYPNERITRQEALWAYTAWAHECSEMDYRRGYLQTGFDADIVLHDVNLLTCADEEILQANVIATYTAGALRYKNENL
jgi:predicted amidohydrolase YtcJ